MWHVHVHVHVHVYPRWSRLAPTYAYYGYAYYGHACRHMLTMAMLTMAMLTARGRAVLPRVGNLSEAVLLIPG